MFIAVLCNWLACTVVFLSSKQQQLFPKPLSKNVAWLIFTLATFVSIYIFAQQQLIVIACLMTLVNIMVIWPVLVFSQGHFRPSLRKYLLTAVSFSAVTHWLGA
jgi:hypothetical protein